MGTGVGNYTVGGNRCGQVKIVTLLREQVGTGEGSHTVGEQVDTSEGNHTVEGNRWGQVKVATLLVGTGEDVTLLVGKNVVKVKLT